MEAIELPAHIRNTQVNCATTTSGAKPCGACVSNILHQQGCPPSGRRPFCTSKASMCIWSTPAKQIAHPMASHVICGTIHAVGQPCQCTLSASGQNRHWPVTSKHQRQQHAAACRTMPQRQVLGAVGGGFEACRSEPKFSHGGVFFHNMSNL